ncbi:MAG: hypothetical protein MSIBF_02160 [Candidatus Altiarchaeales archaeon IMC4]|nr:MAG: hypothetical protein MSIBF_02160 [Candidatus Altiarchaeales archaeon IMC4]
MRNIRGALTLLSVFSLIAFISFYTTYTIHSNYPLPFHSDEWDHLTIAKEIVKQQDAIYYDPYIKGSSGSINLELNYHLMLAIMLQLTGLDGITFALIFPAIIMFVLGVNTFVLVRYLTKSDLAGFFSAVLVLTVKSNVTLLGLFFMVPVAYGMSMIPLVLFVFLRAVNSDKLRDPWLFILAVLVVQVAMSHPPSASIYLPIFALYFIFHPGTLWKNKWKLIIPVFAALVLLPLFFHVPLVSVASPWDFINHYLKFGYDDPDYHVYYYTPRYLGATIIILALLGAYIAALKRQSRILPLAILALLPFVVQFYQMQEIYFSPYRRMLMYNFELLLMLAGIGLWGAYAAVNRINRRYDMGFIFRSITAIVVLLITASILLPQVDSTFEYKNRLYHCIEPKDVAPMLWIKENTKDETIVLAQSSPCVSKAIKPIADRYTVATVRTRLGTSDARNNDVNEFFRAGCGTKKEILEKYTPDYVFSGWKIECQFLNEIHAEKGDYVYEVKL